MKVICEKHGLGHHTEAECPLCSNAAFLESEDVQSLDSTLMEKLVSHFEAQAHFHLFTFRKNEAEEYKHKSDWDELNRRYELLKQEFHDFDIRKKTILEGAFAEIRRITEKNFDLYLSNLKPYSEHFFEEFESKLKDAFKKFKPHERLIVNMVIKTVREKLKISMKDAFLAMSDKRKLTEYRDKHANSLTRDIKAPLDRAINSITQEAIKMLDLNIEANERHSKGHSIAIRWGAFLLFGIATFSIGGTIYLLSKTNLANIQSGWAILPFSGLFLLSIVLIFLAMKTLRLNITDRFSNRKESELSIDEMFGSIIKGTQLSTEVLKKVNELKTALKTLVDKNTLDKTN
ncbi:MAG: hypothetical protein IPN76_22010 [Saprospiraceae bacterium]|nr:hypothetical protein [Saprospiraceae bacterium]